MLHQDGRRETISARETYELVQKDSSVVILDVRTPEEFYGSSGHVEGSILIPVQELDQRVEELAQYKDRTIIAVCRSGNRSGHATAFLNEKGFRAMNMVGGMIKWRAEQLPVVFSKE
jgi:rhodanese-related sulfurtransferase